MAWHKITFTVEDIRAGEHEKLKAEFSKVYEHYRNHTQGIALLRSEKDATSFYLNSTASAFCEEIIKKYNAVQSAPSKNLQVVVGDDNPLSLTS